MQLVQMLWNDKKYDLVSQQCKAAQEYNPEEMVFYYFGGMAYYLSLIHISISCPVQLKMLPRFGFTVTESFFCRSATFIQ